MRIRDRAPTSLQALLGPQRAAALLLLDAPTTAGRLAKALHTVPAGATHHLRGLEAAGLVTRERRGQYVIVARTARGTALLDLFAHRGGDDARQVSSRISRRSAAER
jgi:DNA-binding transcriptional ArsR family regulator